MPGKRLTEQERGQIEAFWRAGVDLPRDWGGDRA
ncbi:hypothetical protein FB388_3442 [Pseudonocardia cypriaca]|uniref:Uncharacterized protein n=1 Tax=Pseudonocardia cypriaca TaxID=882449 RepID=A0A543GIX7_9PSEU|nr:hypothetical protein FB388_3442 [Pseudonocardia cypriaca]